MKLEFLDVVESEYYANCLYALIDESFKQMISLAVKDVHDLMPIVKITTKLFREQ